MKNSSSSHEPMTKHVRPLLRKETTGSASSMEDGPERFRPGSISSNQSVESDTEITRGERDHQKYDDMNKKRLKHGSRYISKNMDNS